MAAYNEFDLDGIDIDWEYPGQEGSGNVYSAEDTNNFLLFLQLLRKTLPPTAMITAAVQTSPFAGPDGNPIQNASSIADVLDWILIMNYDIWGCQYHFSPPPPRSKKKKQSQHSHLSFFSCSIPNARA
jgi:chitinase